MTELLLFAGGSGFAAEGPEEPVPPGGSIKWFVCSMNVGPTAPAHQRICTAPASQHGDELGMN